MNFNRLSISKDTENRERRIDEALKESFPASDTPSFVGAGTGPKEVQDLVDDDRSREATCSQEQRASR